MFHPLFDDIFVKTLSEGPEGFAGWRDSGIAGLKMLFCGMAVFDILAGCGTGYFYFYDGLAGFAVFSSGITGNSDFNGEWQDLRLFLTHEYFRQN